MVFAMLLNRGLGSVSTKNPVNGREKLEILRILCGIFGALSLIADIVAFYWFARMKRKFRHTLIALLILAALLKDVDFVVFAIGSAIDKDVTSKSGFTQACGFFNLFLTEITDFTILAIVIHMSVQILTKNTGGPADDGLYRYRYYLVPALLGIPFAMACIAFVDRHGGYAIIGALALLPVRPFWFRLALSWIPRYIISVTIVTLTILIRLRVGKMQRKLAELQANLPVPTSNVDEIIEEEDMSPMASSEGITPIAEKPGEAETPHTEMEQRELDMTDRDLPPMPSDHEPFSATDLRKFKRMSYKRRTLAPLTTAGIETMPTRPISTVAPSLAPSSAVFASPRDQLLFNESDVRLDKPSPLRRQSVAEFSVSRSQSVHVPQRRRSLVDISSTRPNSAAGRPQSALVTIPQLRDRPQLTHRRSSIWDEIDASLEKKVTSNRLSIFTITASETAAEAFAPVVYNTDAIREESANADPARPKSSSRPTSRSSPTRDSFVPGQIDPQRQSWAPGSNANRNSHRQSKIYDLTRRAMSVISVRVTPQDMEDTSPEAILRRRHRYITRQMRHVMFYPICYLALWAFPFVLHVLQYNDAFAAQPPYPVIVLAAVSLTAFGLVNSIVFCLREKPWALVEGGVGSDPVARAVLRLWDRVRGRERDGKMDFEG